MPFGPEPIGLAAFVGVKLAGYSAAGWALGRRFQKERPRPLTFGLARTVLGVGVGVMAAFLAGRIGVSNSAWLFYPLLLPFRIVEWLLVLSWFYPDGFPQRHPSGRRLRYALAGSAWSYALDAAAIAGRLRHSRRNLGLLRPNVEGALYASRFFTISPLRMIRLSRSPPAARMERSASGSPSTTRRSAFASG